MNDDVKTYRIETLADFLAVPADRVEACLIDFASYLSIVRSLTTETDVAWQTAFIWRDDGRSDVTITLTATVTTGEVSS